MGHGGKRPGAGRKPGVANRKTAEIANRAAAEGITPLEVLLRTMRNRWAAGDEAGAAAIAKDAAPYMHARLSQVDMNATVRRTPTDFTDAELAAIAGSDGGEDGDGEAPLSTH